MSTATYSLAVDARKNANWRAPLIAILFMMAVSGTAMAAEKAASYPEHHPKDYVLIIDPHSSKVIGTAMVRMVTNFFDYADNAIKTKDTRALSFLYSEKYMDGNHTKADTMLAWKRLFDEFDDLTMTHTLRFITTDPNSNVVIVQCSGILMGKPKKDLKQLQALDHWMNMNHILVKEDSGWKIIGTAGIEDKRFWFDKPMHPLF